MESISKRVMKLFKLKNITKVYSIQCDVYILDSQAIVTSLLIGVFLILLNVYVNWHVVFNLTKHPLIDAAQLNVGVFRLIIALCQVVGSVVCLMVVDRVERKVRIHKSKD